MHRSQFSSFSESLGASLAPLLVSLQDCGRLVADLDGAVTQRVAKSMLSVRSVLEETLVEASERRPHLLVAGPPKSGKSTLMVALARNYVTKVSDQPTLPAPVRVTHAPAWSVVLVRNDGTQELFKEPARARIEIQTAHRSWADGVRRAELARQEFDPRGTLPRGVRLVELQAPARALAESRLALVEVPHIPLELSLAREHVLGPLNNEVAATVLVLRTEDLARPEMLRAYEPLLRESESVHLVLNMDRDRADLGADGKRVCTMDTENPVGVVESFQALGAAPLWLEAFDNGRLRVHLLPLLEIAAGRISGRPGAGVRGGRAHLTPRPRHAPDSRDALAGLEEELVGGLHQGAPWQAHVQGTLSSVDGVLRGLQDAFDEVSPKLHAAPGSMEPGVVGLQRVRDSMRMMRKRHVAPF